MSKTARFCNFLECTGLKAMSLFVRIDTVCQSCYEICQVLVIGGNQ
jgi:hypothetical protein